MPIIYYYNILSNALKKIVYMVCMLLNMVHTNTWEQIKRKVNKTIH